MTMTTIETLASLEERLNILEKRQIELDALAAQVQRALQDFKNRHIQAGPLGPLAKALTYHHKQNNGWTALASAPVFHPGPAHYVHLQQEFVKMRDVVIQYEYVAQSLLGINPSPLADLEEENKA